MRKKKIIKEQTLEIKAYILKKYQSALDRVEQYRRGYANAQDKTIDMKCNSYCRSDEDTSDKKALVNYWEGVANCYKWTIEWLDEMFGECCER